MKASNVLSFVKSAARSVGVGKLYRLGIQKPMNTVKQSIREGGPLEQWRTRRGKEEMIEAAQQLPKMDPPSNPSEPMKVYFLTGKDHWYQSLFCFLSLQRFCEDRITPVLYSDGSLSEVYRKKFRRVVPWVEIQTLEEIEARLDGALPKNQYSLLREWRHIQPLTRKITDLHAGSDGWKLLLDSDMLFFRKPQFLIDYLRQPERPCFMVDINTAYGYSPRLRYTLADGAIPEAANIGIFGLKSDSVDFDRLQHWLKVMIEEEDTHYNITQGLSSLLFAGQECNVAPPDEYVVFPSLREGKSPSVTLHHYVAESKRAYFQYGWRSVYQKIV